MLVSSYMSRAEARKRIRAVPAVCPCHVHAQIHAFPADLLVARERVRPCRGGCYRRRCAAVHEGVVAAHDGHCGAPGWLRREGGLEGLCMDGVVFRYARRLCGLIGFVGSALRSGLGLVEERHDRGVVWSLRLEVLLLAVLLLHQSWRMHWTVAEERVRSRRARHRLGALECRLRLLGDLS